MDLGIKGRWALVGGASKGLGYGCAEALVREGASVVVVARTEGPLQLAVQRLQGLRVDALAQRVIGVAADITSGAGRAAVFAQAGGPGTNFDIVITNAGGPPPGDFRDWQRDDWIAAVDANMLTPIELIKATVDGMAARRFGRIINITSTTVKAPIDNLGLSSGARSGLTGFVAGLARSPLAEANVTINNLLPGAFDTDRLRKTVEAAAQKPGQTIDMVLERRRQSIPAGRLGTTEEFGAICAFICSQHASYITGQNILADGGAYPGSF